MRPFGYPCCVISRDIERRKKARKLRFEQTRGRMFPSILATNTTGERHADKYTHTHNITHTQENGDTFGFIETQSR